MFLLCGWPGLLTALDTSLVVRFGPSGLCGTWDFQGVFLRCHLSVWSVRSWCVFLLVCVLQPSASCTSLIQTNLFELPVVHCRGFKVAMHGFDISEYLASWLRQEKNKVFLSLCNNEKQ